MLYESNLDVLLKSDDRLKLNILLKFDVGLKFDARLKLDAHFKSETEIISNEFLDWFCIIFWYLELLNQLYGREIKVTHGWFTDDSRIWILRKSKLWPIGRRLLILEPLSRTSISGIILFQQKTWKIWKKKWNKKEEITFNYFDPESFYMWSKLSTSHARENEVDGLPRAASYVFQKIDSLPVLNSFLKFYACSKIPEYRGTKRGF